MPVRPIEVKGLNKLRRDLRRANPEVAKELRRDIRTAAGIIAERAGQLAPVGRTGRLAQSYRGTTSGLKGIVRSPLVYARFIEYGFHPGGGRTFIEGQTPIGSAMERYEGEFIDDLGDAIDRAADRVGWHR